MKLIQVTDAASHALIWLNVAQIVAFTGNTTGSTITTTSNTLAIREDPHAVQYLITTS